MSAKAKSVPPSRGSYSMYISAADREAAQLLKDLGAYCKSRRRSKRAVTASLKRAGILDKKGELAKRYRS